MDSVFTNYYPETLKTSSNFYQSFGNKRLLRKLKKQISSYSGTFSSTLTDHLKNEFEINVRENQITPEGREKLEHLQKEFKILQYEDNLGAIFASSKSFCKNIISKTLLDVVYEEVLLSFHGIIKTVQNVVLKDRKEIDNNLCSEKISHGPGVFNFTSEQIPEKLMKHLNSGLNNKAG